MFDDFEIIDSVEQNLPFHGDLPNDLKPGDVLSVYGFVLPHCIRFAINLTCDRTPNCDVGFHFNPRLSPRYIARNSRMNGIWGKEETTSYVKFEMPRSTRIIVDILFTEFTFEVSINGKHFCGYSYRMPLSNLKHLEINGAFLVEDINHRNVKSFPDNIQLNDNFHRVPIVTETIANICDCNDDTALETPFIGNIPKKLPPIYKLEIHGRTKLLPHVFFVNLQVGRHIWPHPSVPFHLNPRFNTVYGENILIRNSWYEGKWENEERSSVFPFVPGDRFKIVIYREPEHYSIWINGKLNGEFKYRNPDVDQVDTCYIQGDLVLHKVFIVEKNKKKNKDDDEQRVNAAAVAPEDDDDGTTNRENVQILINEENFTK